MAKIIPFRTREELEKEKRENVWEEWLEWERFEEEIKKYHESKESEEALNFDDPEDVKDNFMTQEELDVLQQEERIARKEMMRNKKEETSASDISPAEWEWLKEWVDSKK